MTRTKYWIEIPAVIRVHSGLAQSQAVIRVPIEARDEAAALRILARRLSPDPVPPGDFRGLEAGLLDG